MQPTWVLEANLNGLPTETIAAEVVRQGMACHIVKYLPTLRFPKDLAGAESLPMDACVIFRGTLTLLRHISLTRRWHPTAWCEFDNFACSNYYAFFGRFLLNRDYALLPYAEVIRLSDSLFHRFGDHGQIFVRPNSVDKNFAGCVLDASEFDSRFCETSFDPTLLVLVARPKKLYREWRFIIANGQVIAGSQYRDAAERIESAGCPTEVLDHAKHILANVAWRPAPLFVMDICETDDGFRLLELNSFGCSGHYLCDVPKVVEAASRIASLAW